MSRSPRWAILIVLTLLPTLVYPTSALSQCGSSCLQLIRGKSSCQVVAAFDFSHETPDAQCSGTSGYDLPAGILYNRHACGPEESGLTYASLSVRDVYSITGPPAGVPIQVEVVLRVTSSGTCSPAAGGEGSVGFGIGFGSHDAILRNRFCNETGNALDFALELRRVISLEADEPTEISFYLRLKGSEFDADATGSFHFEGLPEGARVISCHGYEQDAVQLLATSWGRLKSIYR